MSSNSTQVYLEVGQKRVFAVVPSWPGWCRSGNSEDAALQTLLDYAPRYAQILTGSGFAFPQSVSDADLFVVEKLPGNGTTDFGAPAIPLPFDDSPVGADELARMQKILAASWHAFDRVVQAAQGRSLRTGPRGGGRDLAKMVSHVREAERAYLAKLGGTMPETGAADPAFRQALLNALAASAHGKISPFGSRGGARWTPRFFVRRTAWHALDHAWEIEDRIE